MATGDYRTGYDLTTGKYFTWGLPKYGGTEANPVYGDTDFGSVSEQMQVVQQPASIQQPTQTYTPQTLFVRADEHQPTTVGQDVYTSEEQDYINTLSPGDQEQARELLLYNHGQGITGYDAIDAVDTEMIVAGNTTGDYNTSAGTLEDIGSIGSSSLFNPIAIDTGFQPTTPNFGNGIDPNFSTLQPTTEEILNGRNPTVFEDTADGQSALSELTQNKDYSNKQFVSPFFYTVNVEGTLMTVDYLGKKVITDNNMPYRSIASLKAQPLTTKTINDPFMTGLRKVKQANKSGTPMQNAAAQIFGSGNGFLQTLNRFTAVGSPIQNPNTGKLSEAGGLGAITNIIPTSQYNQVVAKLPGVSLVTNALGRLPGTSSLTSALNNPVGSSVSLVQNAAKSLKIQANLPSASIGSLGKVFTLAAGIASSGPPTSLTGLINLELQVKAIACDFVFPTLTLLQAGESLLKVTFPKPEDIKKQIKKEFDDFILSIKNRFDFQKQWEELKKTVENPKLIIDPIVKKYFTCQNSANSKASSKAGKKSQSSGVSTATFNGKPVD